MARHVPAPMPIHLVLEHPKALAMQSASLGMLIRLATHYWFTECKPLPVADGELFLLSRAHRATWVTSRDDIKAVLQDVTPLLAYAFEARQNKVEGLKRLRAKSASVVRAQTLERKNAAFDITNAAPAPKVDQANRAEKVAKRFEPSPAPNIEVWKD